jgi:hypothetical protein
VSHRPSFAVTLSLSVLVLAFFRCLISGVPGVGQPHDPPWFLYVLAGWRAALEAFIVFVISYSVLTWSKSRATAATTQSAILLAIPLAAIGVLENRVRIPITTSCAEGIACNPYGLRLTLESNLHLFVLAAAAALVAIAVGRGRLASAAQPPPNKPRQRTSEG